MITTVSPLATVEVDVAQHGLVAEGLWTGLRPAARDCGLGRHSTGIRLSIQRDSLGERFDQRVVIERQQQVDLERHEVHRDDRLSRPG